ncbi:tigger transposable element-derived protein 6-like [Limulus polyphemus]|uniref:Tigger transposable element-derived protein 6-like n=1 Tax=Limulus polyphemus TaxID=6850 RepID=A0ABM1BBV7_LIMPO|nr:tigger transposable element-derived protein 6-like [Limulus polyphemus]
MLSVELGLDDFSASNGWLDRFQKRHNISCSVLSGEGASVNEEMVNDWCSRLESMCEGYSLKDIFNANETGLFNRALPTRSQVIRSDKCHRGKNSKERITVLLGCSAMGKKHTPLVISRAANPRCFRGNSTSSLPVTYQANKRAWMTSTIFKDWLQKLNNKMTLEKRKIIMFVDNCAAHPAMTLSNVKLVFLPPNTTARLQPCDGGIIKAVISTYRKKPLCHILLKMNEASTAADLAGKGTVLDAISWLKYAWDCVQAETIQKCFAHCGFIFATAPTASADATETAPAELLLLLQGSSWADFIECDNEVTATTEVFGVVETAPEVEEETKTLTASHISARQTLTLKK